MRLVFRCPYSLYVIPKSFSCHLYISMCDSEEKLGLIPTVENEPTSAQTHVSTSVSNGTCCTLVIRETGSTCAGLSGVRKDTVL